LTATLTSPEEQNLQARLFDEGFTFDEALRLYTLVTQREGNFPLEWEERVLELGLATFPGRADMRARLQEVKRRLGRISNTPTEQVIRAHDPVVSAAKLRFANAGSGDGRLPSHGLRWGAYVEQMRRAIGGFSSPEQVLHHAQTSIGFEHRGNIHHEGKFTALYERELYAEFPQFAGTIERFSDISGSAPETNYEHKGRLVSNVLFYLARVVLSCLSHIREVNIVLEVGGGYGAPARTWLRNPIRPPQCYIILDIPESLFFADVFLRQEFGDASVYYVERESPLSADVFRNHAVVLCPLSRHAALYDAPVDLVINTGSMQEMSEAWVDFYMTWLDRQRTRWFYSLNYFGQPISYLAESANLWSPRPGARWVARLLRWNPPLVRMQSERNYLEALYEKDADPVPTGMDATERAERLHSRYMTGELLVEYMDLIRRTPDPKLMLVVVHRIMNELPFHPKEGAYLVDGILTRPRNKEVEHYRRELEGYRAILQGERETGTEEIH